MRERFLRPTHLLRAVFPWQPRLVSLNGSVPECRNVCIGDRHSPVGGQVYPNVIIVARPRHCNLAVPVGDGSRGAPLHVDVDFGRVAGWDADLRLRICITRQRHERFTVVTEKDKGDAQLVVADVDGATDEVIPGQTGCEQSDAQAAPVGLGRRVPPTVR